MSSKKITVQKLVVIGVMAAMVYVATNFRIDIPTPLGKTMLHLGNVMCILSGLLFGGFIGGLSAGIGSAFFDLLDPTFAPEFMITFAMKFVLGYVSGKIAYSKLGNGNSQKQNIIAAICGAFSYVILYILKTFVTNLIVLGNKLEAVIPVVITKGTVSTVNAIIAIIVSVIIATAIKPRLQKSGIYKNL